MSFDKGERISLGKGSFSTMLLTSRTVRKTKSMMGVSVFKPGTITKQRIHLKTEELAYVIRGSGNIIVGNNRVMFRAKDSIYIPPLVPHGVENNGIDDVVMVFYFGTPQYPPSEDA